MDRLKDKVAIITGGAQGMGESHVRTFIKEGGKVVIGDIKDEKGAALAKELGENALFLHLDVTDETNWQEIVAETKKHFGKIDILINNAGITMNKSLFDLTKEEYLRLVSINQLSSFFGIKTVAKIMKEQQSGSIVNISSLNGIVAGSIGYTDTKFAVRGMAKAAAKELAPFKVRVNSVHPGAIETPMLTQGDTEEAVKQMMQWIPLKRIGKPEEVSQLVLYLASDESSYITGSEYIIDGGITV